MSASFVCCVESGFLESQALRMAESLRKFGGSFSRSPIFAVTPRFGPPISRHTLRRFHELDVSYLRLNQPNKYSWFNFLNKPLALLAAEPYVQTPNICWLDSDLLFLNEPGELDLQDGESFAGFPVEAKEMGTAGSEDPHDLVWREFCRLLNIDIEKLPWVTTAETGERVRLYFNGGIFVYRKNAEFAQTYYANCLKLLASPPMTAANFTEGIKEMSSIGFAVIMTNLKWRELSYSHDYVMSSFTHNRWYKENALRRATVIHYHDAMWPHFWETFLSCILTTHPKVADWLEQLGPMRNTAPLPWRVATRLLRKKRKMSEARYKRSFLL